MFKFLNNALIDNVYNYDVVLVPMSVNNSMSKGFRYEVALNFPIVREKESKTPYGDRRKYGTIYSIEADGIIFCMLYMYKTKYYKKQGENDSVDYKALEDCLKKVVKLYKGKKIGTPILGYSEYDGNGNKDKILTVMGSVLETEDVTIHVYEQKDYKAERFKEIAILHKKLKNREINGNEYIRLRSEVEWRRRYGIFKPMREGYRYIPRQGEIN